MESGEFFRYVAAPFLNFFMFLGIAYFAFRKPLQSGAMRQREEYLKQFEEARKVKAEADASLLALETRVKNFDQELREIQNNAETLAKAQAEQILANAEALAQNLVSEARNSIETEAKQSFESLKRLMVAELKGKLGQRIESELSETRQHQIFDAEIRKISSELRN
jgi:F0F1-type ATP synthase membrane subunit b/b'